MQRAAEIGPPRVKPYLSGSRLAPGSLEKRVSPEEVDLIYIIETKVRQTLEGYTSLISCRL
jgi:hypothetical protein